VAFRVTIVGTQSVPGIPQGPSSVSSLPGGFKVASDDAISLEVSQ
jgi:hypothetical protein